MDGTAKPSPAQTPKTSAPNVILALALLVSIAAWGYAEHQVATRIEATIDQEVGDAKDAIKNSLDHFAAILYGLQGLFGANPQATRLDFHRYIQAAAVERRFPGAKIVQFLRYVPLAAKADFERSVRVDSSLDPGGYPQFAIRPPGERPDYYVHDYVEPWRENQILFGLDAAFEPSRRGPLEQARDSGQLTGSGRITLIKETQGPRAGFVMRLPIYRWGVPADTTEQRRDAFIGLAVVVLRMNELVAGVLRESFAERYSMTIHDLGFSGGPLEAPSAQNLLFESPAADQPGQGGSGDGAAESRILTLNAAGRHWTMAFTPLARPGASYYPKLVLLAGVAMSLMLFWVVRTNATARAKAIAMADDLTLELREREARLRAITRAAPVGIFGADKDGRYVYVNPTWSEITGMPAEQAMGDGWTTALDPEDRERVIGEWRDWVVGNRPFEDEYRFRRPDGRVAWVVGRVVTERTDSGELIGHIGAITEITGRKRAEKALAESEEKFRLITENVGDLVAMLDPEGRRLYNSPSYRALFGESSVLASDSFAEIHPDDRERIRQVFRDSIASGIGRVDEFRFVRPDGSVRYVESRGSVIKDAEGKVSKLIVVSRDITERKLAEQHIHHLAQHDSLTNLPNRMLLQDRIGQAIVQARRHGNQVAVVFIDLDRFKTINDSLGHPIGDRVLLACAERLITCLRQSDTVARLGGDEFVVVLPDAGTDSDVGAICGKLLDTLAQPLTIDEHEMHLGASIGIAFYPQDGEDAESLMRKADTAMYHAKASGRNNFQFFTAQMNAAVQQRLHLGTGLRQALARDEFVLHYQPQVDLASGRIAGLEALIRWNQPGKGLTSPGEFIPVAEDIGLIVPIGEWVLRTACRQSRKWQAEGLPACRIAVNLSARQFRQKDLPLMISGILADTGLDPRLLELELTESETMEHAAEALAMLNQLSALGVQITIDDFGTGYSSLSYLRQLPIDRLKVDRSFVRDIHSDPNDAAIVTAIIALAHSLKLKVVAEGVETAEQLAFLRAHACDEAQGFHLAKPMPAERIEALLQESEESLESLSAAADRG